MENNVAIEVSGLSKAYKLYDKPIDRLKESLNIFGKKYHDVFYALKNVSFKVRKGETVGIIGENGSGKSTLLKIITGVLQPTIGSVKVEGKISALLELGAGFNPEYTGYENIYLNGAIMGFTKAEIDNKVEKIIEFADIGDFINQPVKMYSSGMFARLAFAVAINVDPDILIVDEALSVGDMHFQEKSFTKMKEFRKQGKTIFFVSHSLSSVRNFCDRAVWIEHGNIRMIDYADVVCSEYQDFINDQKEELHEQNNFQEKNTTNKINIVNVSTDKTSYMIDEDISISINLDFREEIVNYGIGVIIYNSAGSIVTLFNTVRDDIYFEKMHSTFTLRIPKNDFVKGKYFISVIISDEISMFPYDRKDFIAKFFVETKKNRNGIPIADGMFRSKHSWNF